MTIEHLPLTLANRVESSELLNAMGTLITGFLFVIIVLAMLSLITALLGKVFKMTQYKGGSEPEGNPSAHPAPAAQAAPAAQPVSATGQDEDELAAVVAAAIHTMMEGKPHRIVSIKSSQPGWAEEGRRQIFSSHRVR